jgi:hypothetical protein
MVLRDRRYEPIRIVERIGIGSGYCCITSRVGGSSPRTFDLGCSQNFDVASCAFRPSTLSCLIV